MVHEADEYPLDEDAMLVLMEMAGWHYYLECATQGHYLESNRGEMYRVPVDLHGRTIPNAFKMYLWLTNNYRNPDGIRAAR
jgi:hypothetical protein